MGLRITVDGGGTKLLLLVFDENYKLIAEVKGGPVNQLYTKRETVKENVRECARKLAEISDEYDIVYDCIVGNRDDFIEDMNTVLKIGKYEAVREHGMQLAGGMLSTTGFLALSGTGSGLSYIRSCEPVFGCGGWGYEVGDQGSGAHLGMMVLREIVKAESGWGTPTVMRDMLVEAWELKDLRDMINKLHYSEDPRTLAASLARMCGKAALMGDKLAIDIYKHMGLMMAEQFVGLLNRYNYDGDRCFRFTDNSGIKREEYIEVKKVCANGGTWRGSPYMFESFREHLAQHAPGIEAAVPIFSPIMGGITVDICKKHGTVPEETAAMLKQEYAAYTFAFDRL